MANPYWINTDTAAGAYSTAGNWSGAAVPVATDNVRFTAQYTGIVTTGLNQSAVALTSFLVEDGYSGTIGSLSLGYLQIATSRFEFSGTGESWINLGATAVSPQIFKTASNSAGKRGLYLKGTNITTLNIVGGSVGVAMVHGDVSTITTVRVLGSGSDLILGAGVTLTTIDVYAGKVLINCAATTVRVYGGEVRTRETGAITNLTVYGGTVYPESTGTITNWVQYGGDVDFTRSGAARTITNWKHNGGSWRLDPNVVTRTTQQNSDWPMGVSGNLAA